MEYIKTFELRKREFFNTYKKWCGFFIVSTNQGYIKVVKKKYYGQYVLEKLADYIDKYDLKVSSISVDHLFRAIINTDEASHLYNIPLIENRQIQIGQNDEKIDDPFLYIVKNDKHYYIRQGVWNFSDIKQKQKILNHHKKEVKFVTNDMEYTIKNFIKNPYKYDVSKGDKIIEFCDTNIKC